MSVHENPDPMLAVERLIRTRLDLIDASDPTERMRVYRIAVNAMAKLRDRYSESAFVMLQRRLATLIRTLEDEYKSGAATLPPLSVSYATTGESLQYLAEQPPAERVQSWQPVSWKIPAVVATAFVGASFLTYRMSNPADQAVDKPVVDRSAGSRSDGRPDVRLVMDPTFANKPGVVNTSLDLISKDLSYYDLEFAGSPDKFSSSWTNGEEGDIGRLVTQEGLRITAKTSLFGREQILISDADRIEGSVRLKVAQPAAGNGNTNLFFGIALFDGERELLRDDLAPYRNFIHSGPLDLSRVDAGGYIELKGVISAAGQLPRQTFISGTRFIRPTLLVFPVEGNADITLVSMRLRKL
jgi:hypothetical protein